MDNRSSAKGTLLLVEDERTQRENACQILRSDGYTVMQSPDFAQAVVTFDRYRDEITLLVTGIALADGNGCDLAVTLQTQKPGLRVLFMSGSVGAEVCRFYGLELEDVHFLRKPFQAEDLVLRAREVLAADAVAFERVQPPKTFSASGNSRPE